MVIFSAAAAVIGAATAFIGGLGIFGTAALQIVAGIGVSYLAKALAGKKSTASTSTGPSGVQGSLATGGDVARSFMVGDGATAGSLVYANTWGNDGQTPNAYFTQVIALSDLPIASLNEVWVNGNKVTLGAVADADKGFPVTEYFKDGRDHLWIKFYDGNQTAADSFLVSKVSNAGRPYESTRVGTGVAYAICTSLVEDTLFTGFPTCLFGVSGIPLYDPSKDSTNGGDGDHRFADPATWGGDGDKLPAVQIYNLLRGLTYNDSWFYGLQGVASTRLPAANWIAQINKCREEVEASAGETEPAYRSGGQVELSSQLADTIESLLTTCHGKLSEVGGFYKVFLGAPDSAVFAFTDDDILSTEEQSFAPFFGLSDTVNGVTAKFPDPEQGWQTTAAPPLYRTDLEVEAGNRRLLTDVSLDFVPYSAQAQRLMLSALNAAQRARRHTLSFSPKFWYVEPGDVGEWTSARNGYDAKLFEVNGAVDKANLDVTLDITEVDPADYDWNHDTDFQPVSPGTTGFLPPAPQPIVDWYAEPWIIKDSNGINRRPAIRVSWDPDMPGVVGVEYQVRLKFNSSSVTSGRSDQVDAASLVVSHGLLPATVYQTRGRYTPSSPRDVLWSDWLDVTTPDVRFSVLDFDNSIHELVNANFASEAEKIDKIVQVVASTVVQVLSKSTADKQILRSTIHSTRDALSASIDEVRTVAVSNEEAVAALETTVTAQFGEQAAQIATNQTAIADIFGSLAAQYTVTLDVNGYASGFKAFNDGTTSAFTVSADIFKVAWPGQPGGDPVDVFQIANVDGEAKLAFRGDMFADGEITAKSLNVGELSSLTTNLGDATFSGKIRSVNDVIVIDCTNPGLTISEVI